MKSREIPQPRERQTETEISEVFSSIQGEGPYLGVRQVFVRFGRCNMHCGYCDELDKMQAGSYRIRSLADLTAEVDSLERVHGPHHSVSLTGGEPLVYGPFLERFLPALKKRGLRTYLETNGTLPRQLERVARWCDVIAMDLKPASSTGDRSFEDEHRAFLRIASRRELFVKVVVTPATSVPDVVRCVELVAGAGVKIPFILQPLSEPVGLSVRALERIEKEFFALAQSRLADVRVIPQMHKIWGVR